jgi:ubiquinol-cytochrome c reductase cytochrome c1 subunit
MFKKLGISAVLALGLTTGAMAAGGETAHLHDVDFSFEGPFGSYDKNQLQRGLQVYTEVCAACHGLRYVPIRTLADEGGPELPEDQVRAYAAQFDIYDPELDEDRPGKPTDHFPEGTYEGAPDLSLMAKGRAGFHGPLGTGISQFFNGIGGAEYIANLMQGYTGETKTEAGTTFYANKYFPGGWIAMAPPLSDEIVEFADGHKNTVHHMSEDVAAFLMWTAEPKMQARKYTGFVAVLFLALLSVLLYLTNKRLWAPHKGKHH